eukprot:Opistho-2@49597
MSDTAASNGNNAVSVSTLTHVANTEATHLLNQSPPARDASVHPQQYSRAEQSQCDVLPDEPLRRQQLQLLPQQQQRVDADEGPTQQRVLTHENAMDGAMHYGVEALRDGLDPQVLERLSAGSRDRLLVLRVDRDMEAFVRDAPAPAYEFPPMPAFERMLVHKIAAYYGLGHQANATRTAVVVTRLPSARIPALRLGDLPPPPTPAAAPGSMQVGSPTPAEAPASAVPAADQAPPPPPPAMRIMRRDPHHRSHHQRHGHHGDGCGEDGTQNAGSRRQKTIEEREEDYQRARARIFSGSDAPRGSGSSSPDSPSVFRATHTPESGIQAGAQQGARGAGIAHSHSHSHSLAPQRTAHPAHRPHQQYPGPHHPPHQHFQGQSIRHGHAPPSYPYPYPQPPHHSGADHRPSVSHPTMHPQSMYRGPYPPYGPYGPYPPSQSSQGGARAVLPGPMSMHAPYGHPQGLPSMAHPAHPVHMHMHMPPVPVHVPVPVHGVGPYQSPNGPPAWYAVPPPNSHFFAPTAIRPVTPLDAPEDEADDEAYRRPSQPPTRGLYDPRAPSPQARVRSPPAAAASGASYESRESTEHSGADVADAALTALAATIEGVSIHAG